MTAQAILQKSVRYNRVGEPLEVVIPYEQFVELSEIYGWDLDEEEQGDLAAALADSRAGNRDAFIPASEV